MAAVEARVEAVVEAVLDAGLRASLEGGASEGAVRCCTAAREAGLLTHTAGGYMVKVRPDYYALSLPERLSCVGGESTEQLCKCLILENTRRKPLSGDEAAEAAAEAEANAGDEVTAGPPENPRFVCVVFQYRRKLDANKVADVVRSWAEERAPGKRSYNMRLAKRDANDRLSGYAHNGVVPLGMRCRDMRVLVSHHCLNLPGGTFFMGGGDVDVKLKSNVQRFVQATHAQVADITADTLMTDLLAAEGAD